jgi:hypothetical protein
MTGSSGTRRVNLVTNPIISRACGKDQEVFTTSGTYRWSFLHRYSIAVKHVMVATVTFSKWWLYQTLPKGTLISVASLLAASSIKDTMIGATSSEISYHLRDIYSIYIYICCWNVATYKWKVHNGKIEIISVS